MTFVIGVDGGGSRARAVVVGRDGVEMGRSEVRGAVVTADRPDEAARSVEAAVRAAAEHAGVALPAALLWAGLAGAGNDRARGAVERALPSSLSARTVVGTDVEAAFHDAFRGGPGVLLIAGTGSVAWARGEDDTTSRVGGWGQHLGDEGSGYALGSEGLRSIAHSEDGRGPATTLRSAALNALEIDDVVDLIHWAETATKAQVAALAPLVISAADAGDAVAERIVADAVEALVVHVRAAYRAVTPPSGPPPELVLWGGLIASGGPLRARLLRALSESGREASARSLDPPLGAARLALAELETRD